MTGLPQDITLSQLDKDTPRDRLVEVRAYCLDAIKDAYGYDYRPDWHWDLDSLFTPAHSPYFCEQNGAFYMLQAEDRAFIGTAAIRCLSSSPNIVERYGARYPAPKSVAYLCRVYVHRQHRKQGLGDALTRLCRQTAHRRDYQAIYFHCDRKARRLRIYWESLGFTCFAEDDMSAHYEASLTSAVTNSQDPLAA